MSRTHDAGCPECRDSGYVRDWYADAETGVRACARPGCHAAEEIEAAVERELAQEVGHG